jgi:predicted amidohydrolase YtcJ
VPLATTSNDNRPKSTRLRNIFKDRRCVLPEGLAEPLRNISVATTRTAPSGRVLAPEERLTVEQAIRAQTIDAAWQLFADDVVGSLEVGKYADVVVLTADPRSVPPEQIADLEVRGTFLAGRLVYGTL